MQVPSPVIPQALNDSAARFAELRQAIHAHPELGTEVPRTSALVASQLREWGYEVHQVGGHGLVARLRAGSSGRSLGLRADMDALPMQERTGLPYASTIAGRMHACGHDGHTATLMAAAEYLAATRHFDGTLNLIFQPDEEGMTGAVAMLADGLFERFPCDAIFALHNGPGIPVGQAIVQSGPMGGSSDHVTITFRGVGGHGAMPERTADPTLALGLTIVALQGIVARNLAAAESGVISIGKIVAGTTYNIIPQTATLELSVRAGSPDVRARLEKRIREVAHHEAAACGLSAEIDYKPLVPSVFNTPDETAMARKAVASVLGEAGILDGFPRHLGSEDFAWMLEKCPGCYFVLGNGTGKWSGCSVHNEGYDFNDELIPLGAACWVALTEQFLSVQP
jgi:hippurate hydrolase